MSDLLELPHTNGCLVCGHENQFGLNLSLFVNPATGLVSANFAAEPEHIGFEGIIHGGLIATVLDEAMVWAATWNIKRFCVCGELAVRFRRAAQVGEPLLVEARVEFARPKLVQVMSTLRTPEGSVVAAGEGKFVPMTREDSERVTQTFIDHESTRAAAKILAGVH